MKRELFDVAVENRMIDMRLYLLSDNPLLDYWRSVGRCGVTAYPVMINDQPVVAAVKVTFNSGEYRELLHFSADREAAIMISCARWRKSVPITDASALVLLETLYDAIGQHEQDPEYELNLGVSYNFVPATRELT